MLTTLACSDEPLFVLRAAVASPDANRFLGSFLQAEFPRGESLRSCSPCEKIEFELSTGVKVRVHVSVDEPHEIRSADIQSSLIREHYGFLIPQASYFTLECRLQLETIERIRAREERRGRQGVLFAFRDGRMLANATSPEGPCMLGIAYSVEDLQEVAAEFGLKPELLRLSGAEHAAQGREEADFVVDMLNFHVCEENPLDETVELSWLVEALPSSRRGDVKCDLR